MSTCYASVPTKKPPQNFHILAATNETNSANPITLQKTLGAPRPPMAATD